MNYSLWQMPVERETEFMGESKEQHTPLPWKRFDADSLEIVGPDGHTIANIFQCGGIREIDEAEANLDLALRAVSSHEEYKRLLNVSLDLLSDVYESRAAQRFSAIGLSRIKSHITDIRSALAEKES